MTWKKKDKTWTAKESWGDRNWIGSFGSKDQGEINAAKAYDKAVREAAQERKQKPKRKELNFPCEDDGEDEDEDQDEDERNDIPVERRVSQYRLVGH